MDMLMKYQSELSDLVLSCSKKYTDPAQRYIKVIEEKKALRLADKCACGLHHIYTEAMEQGIWPQRYVRNQDSLTIKDQLSLFKSRVAVVGAGGLGGTLILLLCSVGIGNLIIVDYDVFDETNLNRQAVSSVGSIGNPKSEEAARMVQNINPAVNIQTHTQKITLSNGACLLGECNLIVDALDNIQDRISLEQIAGNLQVPYVYGAIAGFCGQVMTIYPEDPGLDRVYGKKPHRQNDPRRSEAQFGVPALTPSFIATMQAMEVVKIILNRGRILRKCMIHMDLETSQIDEFIFA